MHSVLPVLQAPTNLTERRRLSSMDGKLHQGLPSLGFIGFYRQLAHEPEEVLGLANEEAVGSEGSQRCRGRARRRRGTNNGARGQITTQEAGRLRQDKVRLEVFSTKRWRVKIRKTHYDSRLGISDFGQLRSIAGLVMPGLEVHDLCPTDA